MIAAKLVAEKQLALGRWNALTRPKLWLGRGMPRPIC